MKLTLVDPHDPILREALPVYDGDPRELEPLARAMHDTMLRGHVRLVGVGLAANQVGRRERLFIVNDVSKYWIHALVCVNPRIISFSDERETTVEGCLTSAIERPVSRPRAIVAEYTRLDGERIQREFVGNRARIFQHELDHLDGICIQDLAAAA